MRRLLCARAQSASRFFEVASEAAQLQLTIIDEERLGDPNNYRKLTTDDALFFQPTRDFYAQHKPLEVGERVRKIGMKAGATVSRPFGTVTEVGATSVGLDYRDNPTLFSDYSSVSAFVRSFFFSGTTTVETSVGREFESGLPIEDVTTGSPLGLVQPSSPLGPVREAVAFCWTTHPKEIRFAVDGVEAKPGMYSAAALTFEAPAQIARPPAVSPGYRLSAFEIEIDGESIATWIHPKDARPPEKPREMYSEQSSGMEVVIPRGESGEASAFSKRIQQLAFGMFAAFALYAFVDTAGRVSKAGKDKRDKSSST